MTLPLAPMLTIVLLTGGTLLITLEFNRPGLILPGALGLLATLLGFASVLRMPQSGWLATALAAAAILLLVNARISNRLLGICAGALVVAGFTALSRRSGSSLSIALAEVCALLIAASNMYLAEIAHRARANKAVRPASNDLH